MLANVGEGGSIDPIPVDGVRDAVAEIERHRAPDAGPFAVAIGHPGLPSEDELDAYAAAGATWVTATGWLDDMDELIASRPSPSASGS
jgi:hypothetical protein